MKEEEQSGEDPEAGRASRVLLVTTWSDGEASIIKQLLETYGIICQVESDVPHTVFPLSVDGLGEIRVLVAADRLEEARRILAEHLREGFKLVDDGTVGEDDKR